MSDSGSVAVAMFAGVAKVDITPDDSFITAIGESWRLPDSAGKPGHTKVPPTNILDRIEARVLVLQCGSTSLAIVCADLVIFSSQKVVDEAKKQWKVDHVILSATHTHSSMIPRGLCPTGAKPSWGWDYIKDDPGVTVDWPALSEDPWYADMEQKVIAAIGQAARSMFPAQVMAGRGPFTSDYMAHNRRKVNPDGSVSDMWSNPDRLPTEPIDPTVGVIQVQDAAGKVRALLVNYACHPVGLMGSSVLSRDFPGAMVDHVEQQLGDDCMAMFLQGAQGDLDPYHTGFRDEQSYHLMRQCGISLAQGALQLARTLKADSNRNTASLVVKENIVKIGHRISDKTTDACVLTAVINGDMALATIPGEIFVQHQIDLRAQSPLPNTFLLGVAYCGQGSPHLIYIPTAKAALEGGYGADVNRCSWVAGNAGEKMVQAAAAAIRESADTK
jgi:neutral ceramidase